MHDCARSILSLPLREFAKSHDFFIGIDSDGCAFDTMEVKHKECFIPNIIKYYRLAAISKYAREVAEFLNLYSKWRGINRFPGLVLTMDLLAERLEVLRRRPRLPALLGLRAWIGEETRLSNPALAGRGRGDRRPRPRAGSANGARRSTARSAEIVRRSPAVSVRSGIAREHAGQGRRDGRLGDAGRGPGTGMGGARAHAIMSRSWPARSWAASKSTSPWPPSAATSPTRS